MGFNSAFKGLKKEGGGAFLENLIHVGSEQIPPPPPPRSSDSQDTLKLSLRNGQYSSSVSFQNTVEQTQTDNWLTAASYQERVSCRYTAHWYAQWSPMVQNRGHSPWKRKEH